MKKSLTLVSVVAALAVWSSPAEADPIPHGTIALGAERLTGFYHSRESVDIAPVGSTAVTRDKFTLLGETADGPWDLPRIGIDGFIIDGLSLGGNLAIMHTGISQKTTTPAGSGGPPDSSTTGFLFAPRVGYGLMFSERIGFWPRGGFSYYVQTTSSDNGGSDSLHYFSFNIDAPFLFKLAPNFAITAGPTIDIGIEGSHKVELNNNATANFDAGYFGLGIAAGLVALL